MELQSKRSARVSLVTYITPKSLYRRNKLPNFIYLTGFWVCVSYPCIIAEKESLLRQREGLFKIILIRKDGGRRFVPKDDSLNDDG